MHINLNNTVPVVYPIVDGQPGCCSITAAPGCDCGQCGIQCQLPYGPHRFGTHSAHDEVTGQHVVWMQHPAEFAILN